ncbi:hypothetical protein BDF22DRAFT_775051 [Syncephalis plumigaleata]|nr:hypothetical protein BDF22DRAFT_775051 [Syncephalis plumigaleata]
MHFNMNIISTTAVAALLLASIESAESMGLFSNKVVYQGETISGKGALGLPKLELVEVINEQGPVHYLKGKWDGKPATVTCAYLNHQAGKAVELFYTRHTLSNYQGPVDEQTKEGARYFGNVVAAPAKFGRQCYVIDNACKHDFFKQSEVIKNMDYGKGLRFSEAKGDDIVKAVKYVQAKGLLLNFSVNDICFDAIGNPLVYRLESTIPTKLASDHQKRMADVAMQNTVQFIESILYTGTDEGAYWSAVEKTKLVKYFIPSSSPSSPSGSRRNSISGSRRGSMSSTDTFVA